MTNVNEGHRGRMRTRLLKEGMNSFQDHEVLEVFLFPCIPRKDTNKLAHDLINKFGSVSNVMDASPEQLMTVKGISTATACHMAAVRELWRRYHYSATQKIPLRSIGDIIKYTQIIMADNYTEKLVVAYLDASSNLLVTEEYAGNTHSVNVDLKKLVATALNSNAAGIILFHCHVDGVCEPSLDDWNFTERVFDTLTNLHIMLLEHIIFNNNGQYYSFYKEKDLERLALEYNKKHQR